MRFLLTTGIILCSVISVSAQSDTGSLIGKYDCDEQSGRCLEILGQRLIDWQGCPAVKMFVRVTDRYAEMDSSLSIDEFRIEVDGNPTTILDLQMGCIKENLPVDLVFILDGSTSFLNNEMSIIQEELISFENDVRAVGLADFGYWPLWLTNSVTPVGEAFYTSTVSLSRDIETRKAEVLEAIRLEKLRELIGYENHELALTATALLAFREQAVRHAILITDEAYQGGENKRTNVSATVLDLLKAGRVVVNPLIGDLDSDAFANNPSYLRIFEEDERGYQQIADYTKGKLFRFNERADFKTRLNDVLNHIKKSLSSYYCITYRYPVRNLTGDIMVGLQNSTITIRAKGASVSSIPAIPLSAMEMNGIRQRSNSAKLKQLLADTNYVAYKLAIVSFDVGKHSIIEHRIKPVLDELALIVGNECFAVDSNFALISSASPEWQNPTSLATTEIDNLNRELSRKRLRSSLNRFQQYPAFQNAHVNTMSFGRYNPFVSSDLDTIDSKYISERINDDPILMDSKLRPYRSTWLLVWVRKNPKSLK